MARSANKAFNKAVLCVSRNRYIDSVKEMVSGLDMRHELDQICSFAMFRDLEIWGHHTYFLT